MPRGIQFTTYRGRVRIIIVIVIVWDGNGGGAMTAVKEAGDEGGGG